jgi:hypothetical protein
MKDVKRSGEKSGNGSKDRPPGHEADPDSGGHPVVRVTDAPEQLSKLADEFPGYEFATQRTRDGISIVARRHEGCARAGLYAVVTDDPDEMRRALLEHEAVSHQGDSRHRP